MNQKDNSGVLFKNDYKQPGDSKPDYKGRCMVNGTEMEMAAWIKEGAKGRFMSFAFSEPYVKPEQAKPDFDDDIAF